MKKAAFKTVITLCIIAILLGIPKIAMGEDLSQIPYERFLNIRSSVSSDISSDAQNAIFRTNITGVHQLWRISVDGGWPHQLTFDENGVNYAYYLPHENRIVFAMDQEGNERTQLFIMNDDGSNIIPLTDDPDHVYRLGAISRDGKFILYASNKREFQHFDVYTMNLDTLEENLVYQYDAYNSASGFSATGQYIFTSRFHTNRDNDVYMVEIATGDVTHLTPHEESANFYFQGTTLDDSGVYFISDWKTEFRNLRFLDLDTMEWETLYDPGWDVLSVDFSFDHSLMAYSYNEDGYTRVRIIDLEHDKEIYSMPKDNAQIFGITFSKDNRYLLYTRNTATLPSDVWILDLDTKEHRQLTFSATAGIPIDEFIEPELIYYESFDGLEIPAFLYVPKDAKPDGTMPAIISAHGGPESQHRPFFHRTNNYFLSRGFVILAPNIRGSTGYGKTFTHLDDRHLRFDANEDIRIAAEWLSESGWAAPDKIGIMGTSYGGYVVLMALTMYPDHFAAGVSIVGIANLETFLKNTAAWRRHLREAEYGYLETDLELLRELSPINHIDNIKAPLMLIQGANDPRVPQSESDQMAEAIRERGGIVKYLLYEDEGHGLSRLENRLEAYPMIADFFMKYVKRASDDG